MAILTLTSADAGKTIPVSGSVDWSVFGTDAADTIEVAAGASATISGGAGTDVVKLLGGSADYTVKLSGSNVVFTHTSTGKTVTVPVTSAGDSVSFGNGTAVTLKSTGSTVTLGAQTLSATDAAVTGATGTATGTTPTTTTGQAFSLTNSATPDALTLTAGSDTVTGAAGTLGSSDQIIDTSTTDSDVFNLAMDSYISTTASVINVESINATGTYAAVGMDLGNVTGTKTLKLATGVSGGTATVANAAATKAAAVVTADNVSTLVFSTSASGTSGNVNVTAGSAASTVSITGGAGADTVTLNAVANSTLTLDGSTGTDAFTVNLTGGANGLTVTAGTIETLTLNSKTAANTITMANNNALAGVATGNKVIVGGDQALTLKGDLTFVGGTSRTNGVAIEKAAGAAALTLQHSTGTAAAFYNRAVVDTINVTAATGASITINEATTLKLSLDNGTRTYDVDNATTTQIGSGAGTLKLDLTGTSATNAVQTSVTTGAGVGTLVITNNTIDSTLATLDTKGTALTVDTVVVSGSKDLTIGTWTATTNELLTAASLTGKLTVTVGAQAATVVGGSGNDSIAGGGAADDLRGGAGNDTINGGAFADVLTGGTGDDRFVFANVATVDRLTDFSATGTNGVDVLALSLAGAAGTLGAATIATGAGNAYIAAGQLANVKHVAAATTLAAGQNVFVVDGTFASTTALQSAIEAGGSRQLTFANATTIGDDILVAWTDGTTGHFGWVNIGSAATTITASNATYTDIVTLTGVADVTSLASTNFMILA